MKMLVVKVVGAVLVVLISAATILVCVILKAEMIQWIVLAIGAIAVAGLVVIGSVNLPKDSN